jgi:hypothetical protein
MLMISKFIFNQEYKTLGTWFEDKTPQHLQIRRELRVGIRFWYYPEAAHINNRSILLEPKESKTRVAQFNMPF